MDEEQATSLYHLRSIGEIMYGNSSRVIFFFDTPKLMRQFVFFRDDVITLGVAPTNRLVDFSALPWHFELDVD